jgi:hypothetical protein
MWNFKYSVEVSGNGKSGQAFEAWTTYSAPLELSTTRAGGFAGCASTDKAVLARAMDTRTADVSQ